VGGTKRQDSQIPGMAGPVDHHGVVEAIVKEFADHKTKRQHRAARIVPQIDYDGRSRAMFLQLRLNQRILSQSKSSNRR